MVAQSQLPLEDVLSSLYPDSLPPQQDGTALLASAPHNAPLPVSPVDVNKQFMPPLKHPLLPSLTPNSPLPSIGFDPSNVIVDPPLPSSYEVLYSSPSPTKITSGVRYSSLSPKMLVKSDPVPDSPFRQSGDSIWIPRL